MFTKHALVVGALGVTGRSLVSHLSQLDDWNVVGLSRRSPDFDTPAHHIAVDLLDRADCKAKLSDLKDTTHIFYAAYQDKPSLAEQVAPNKAMVVNAVETIEAVAPCLERVVLVQGGKVYGVHLGARTRPRRKKQTPAICRPTSTTIKKITCGVDRKTRPGSGPLSGLRQSVVLRSAIL